MRERLSGKLFHLTQRILRIRHLRQGGLHKLIPGSGIMHQLQIIRLHGWKCIVIGGHYKLTRACFCRIQILNPLVSTGNLDQRNRAVPVGDKKVPVVRDRHTAKHGDGFPGRGTSIQHRTNHSRENKPFA
ncbi:hypothetical protein D3C80_1769660 [compost metagenome]